MSDPTKSTLSPACQRLLEAMQRINYGRILDFPIRAGQPVFDRPLQVIRDIKFAGESGPRQELGRSDFALKAPVVDFFRQLAELGDTTIHSLEVQRGLPFRMQVAEEVCA